jgi:pentatricopeptide repeat protein
MGQQGVERDAITYSAAISACGYGGQWEHALRLLEEMGQQARACSAGRGAQHHYVQDSDLSLQEGHLGPQAVEACKASAFGDDGQSRCKIISRPPSLF